MSRARQAIKRLKAVRNIRTIARTMEMISVARFKKVHDRAAPARQALDRLEDLLRDVVAAAGAESHPLLRAGRSDVAALVVVAGNRGLCGGYNNRVLEAARTALADLNRRGRQVRLYVLGRKGAALIRRRSFPKPYQAIEQSEDPSAIVERADRLGRELTGEFLSGQVGETHVAYQRMHSASVYRPEVMRLLPLTVEAPAQAVPPYEFLPSPSGALEAMLPMAVRLRLLRCLLDAAVSEQLARMTAMRSATSNADDMIRLLTRRMNRLRQGQITLELAEIMGGAEAMRNQ